MECHQLVRRPTEGLVETGRQAAEEHVVQRCTEGRVHGQPGLEQHLRLKSPQDFSNLVDSVDASLARRDGKYGCVVCGQTVHGKSKCRFARFACGAIGKRDIQLHCAGVEPTRKCGKHEKGLKVMQYGKLGDRKKKMQPHTACDTN